MAGFEIAQSTVAKYLVRPPKPPSQTWKTFLRNHPEAIAAIDMCVVPTLTFDLLFAVLVLGQSDRRMPQITEAFPWASAPYAVQEHPRPHAHLPCNCRFCRGP